MEQWGRTSQNKPESLRRTSQNTPENLYRNGHDRSLESIFSSLRLEGTPPSHPVEEVLNNRDDELLMRFRAQELLDRSQQNGISGINGSHQNLNVGPVSVPVPPDFRRMMDHMPVAHPAAAAAAAQQCYNRESDDYSRLNYEIANYNGSCPYTPYLQSTLPVLHSQIIGQSPFVPLFGYGLLPRNHNFGTPNSNNTQSALMGRNELRGNMVALPKDHKNMVAFAKDQQGSNLLQAKLDKGSKEEIEGVLTELIDSVADLMKNQQGSHVILKLFAVCNEEQRTTIIQAIIRNTHQFIGICFCQHGGRAVQKLLDNLSSPQQRSLILSAITPVAVALANDQCGHHVIQHCVRTYSIEYTRHLLNEIANNCFAIATQKCGCCVVQTCVEFGRGEIRDRIIAEILTNSVLLSEDQYGNYVVQHLVTLKLPRVTETLLDRLHGNFVTLSCNKYASNVVEKLILETGEEHSTRIITELITSSSAPSVLVDPYGNFVIQSALQVSKGHLFNALYRLIYVNSESMQSNLYGKKVLDRLFCKNNRRQL